MDNELLREDPDGWSRSEMQQDPAPISQPPEPSIIKAPPIRLEGFMGFSEPTFDSLEPLNWGFKGFERY